MVPYDRPFYGRDLESFRNRFGYTIDDMCFFCGITKNRWFMMVSRERDQVLRDTPIAIMCRLVDADPTLMFVPSFISPVDLLSRITAKRKITKREFSVLMGNNGTSANRWTVSRKRAAPSVFRLAYVVNNMIDKNGLDKAMNKVRDVVNTEGLLRGVPDVMTTGKWTLPTDKTEEKTEES